MKRSRDERAVKRKSTFGRLVAACEWAVSEWAALVRFWNLGLPVPYPVQIDKTEILMEWISLVDENGDLQTAPRLAQTRPSPELLRSYFDQLTEALATMVQNGIVHGDLSAYNLLAQGERLVVIDLPQIDSGPEPTPRRPQPVIHSITTPGRRRHAYLRPSSCPLVRELLRTPGRRCRSRA
jgi:RIO kinase 1